MQIVVSNEGAVTVLKPLGVIINNELDDLEKQLTDLSRNWVKRSVLNLVDVPLIDSAGLELLCKHNRLLNEHGLKIKLCGMNDLLKKIFEITRLTRRFEIFHDSSAAVRSFI